MSARMSTEPASQICSGAMKSSVPNTVPGSVIRCEKSLLNAEILIGKTGENFDGDRTAHHHMLGLEDNAHATRTQAVENSIVAQDQTISRTCLDTGCLVLGPKP